MIRAYAERDVVGAESDPRLSRRASPEMFDHLRPGPSRAPVAVFAAVEAFALVLWMFAGRAEWFYLDDWDFLAARKAGDLGDLFRPHNEHWTTVPILIYRLLFSAFGLRTYVPYRLVAAAFYLVAVALLFVVMRRAGVHPWIATAAASLVALFGPGAQNIMRPFQMSFTGALVFGLVHVLLADHDGPIDRRDWLGLLAGLISLMMSGIAVTLVVVVGIAVLWRRGARPALFHTAPLACCYVVWWLVIGHTGSVLHLGPRRPLTIGSTYGFVEMGLRGAFSSIGRLGGVGVVPAVVLVVGLPLAWDKRRGSSGSRRRGARPRAELAVPVALLIGSIVFLAITAIGRVSYGADYARIPRYVSITTAMLVPALAVAVDALTLHRRWLVPVGIAVFLVGIQPNLLDAFGSQHGQYPADTATRIMMLTLPRDPEARQVPRSLRPDPYLARTVTIGWLLDGVAHERIPEPPAGALRDLRSDNFRLSFDQERGRSPTTGCRIVRKSTPPLKLERGDVIGVFDNAVLITPKNRSDLNGFALQYLPGPARPITVVRNVGEVRFTPETPPSWPRVCVARAKPREPSRSGA